MNHYINTAAVDLSLARNASLLSPTTFVPFPVLGYGDAPTHNFFFHNNGTLEPWSGDASNGLRVTIGDLNLGPTAGTFAATYGQTSASVNCPPSASDVQNALNGLAAMAADGGCVVTGTYPNFAVVMLKNGVPSQPLSLSSSALIPDSSVAVTTLLSGDATHSQRWAVTFRQNSIASVTAWTAISGGWKGTLATNTAAALWLLLTQGKPVGDYVQFETIITVERIQPDTTTQTLYQAAVIVRAKNSDLGATAATALASYLTGTQFLANGVQNYSAIVGLASAVQDNTKLGGYSAGTSGFPVGATIVLNFAVTVNDGAGGHAGTMTMIFQVQASTTNSSPFWVRPWNYNGATNAVAYRLLGVLLDTLPAAYNPATGKFHYLSLNGTAGGVYIAPDQTGTSAPA